MSRSKSVIGVMTAIALVQLISAGAFARSTQTRAHDNFQAIDVAGNVNLVIRQGSDFSVEVSANEDEDLERVITEVRNGTLRIRQEPVRRGWFNFGFFGSGDVEVAVTLPQLVGFEASGGSDVRSEGVLTGELLGIEASGGADLRIDVEVDRLIVHTSGGSDTWLSGSADLLEARTSGGSDLVARGLSVRSADLRSSGGSDMFVAVTDSIVARASGGSDIMYTGNPAQTDLDSSGGADIMHR